MLEQREGRRESVTHTTMGMICLKQTHSISCPSTAPILVVVSFVGRQSPPSVRLSAMAALLLLGCILIGYALPTAIFFAMMMRKAQLVIVMLASAFVWLMAMTVTSLLWSAIPPLHDSKAGWAIVPIGVVLQEIARGLFIRFYFRCERSFSVVSINAIVFPLVDFWSGLAAGVGYGATQSLVYYGPMMAHAMGPGTLYMPHCSAMSALVSAAANAALFNALHVPLMVLGFDAYRLMSPLRIGVVAVLHAAAACLTILNNADDGCIISLPLIGLVVLITWLYAVFITHRAEYRSSKARRVHQA